MTELDIYKLSVSVASKVDWHKVANAMHYLNWCWFTSTEPPNHSELLQAAIDKGVNALRQLEKSPSTNNEFIIKSGGICVIASHVSSKYYLSISFELSQADNYD